MRRSVTNPGAFGFSHHVKALFGLTSEAKWPAEGLPEREVNGWKIWVKPLALSPDTGKRLFRRMRHRAVAQCPKCSQVMSIGRVHQHTCKGLSFGQARGKCRVWQCCLGKTQHGEFVVTPLWDQREDAKYYTNDLRDAVLTAQTMWVEMDNYTKEAVNA